ncbi:hypothetical protein BHE74_00028693 [Ensete ventricosum]|nr:hypothetical protein BHE74_00028693 [Ensete ventricosum]
MEALPMEVNQTRFPDCNSTKDQKSTPVRGDHPGSRSTKRHSDKLAYPLDHETMNIKKEKPAKLKQISQVHPTFPSHGEQLSLRAHTAFSGLEMFRLIAFQVFSSDVTMG